MSICVIPACIKGALLMVPHAFEPMFVPLVYQYSEMNTNYSNKFK